MTRWELLVAHGVIAAATGCAATATHGGAGIQAPDDELMATFASLARRGPEAICNPALLEQALKISIGPLVVHREPPVNDSSTQQVAATTGPHALRRGEFSILTSPTLRRCSLTLEFSDRHLCGLRSGTTARIMGATLRAHEDGEQYSYDFGERDGYRVGVGAGRAGDACTRELVIGARGPGR